MPASLFTSPEIRLEHDQNFFSFSFAALDYTDPKRNRYSCRMLGVDAGWVNAGHRNYASYTHLDPGEYVFQVKGANSDGIWNEEGISQRITITPAWWQTWWFRLGAGALLVSLLVLAYNYRVSQLLRIEHMRVRIASDLHDDIGSRLSSIALMSDVARGRLQKADQEGAALSRIGEIARETANVLKDLVWSIDPECDKLGDILQRMRDIAEEQLGEVMHSVHFPSEGSDIVLDLSTRRNLLLLYKEVLHNIQKHARASMVWIDGSLEQGIFRLEIRDNGVGFNPEFGHGGHGLNNIRQRAHNIDASLNIESQSGHGTTVVLKVKIPRTRYAGYARAR
jgi:signal transduction histidine kinase